MSVDDRQSDEEVHVLVVDDDPLSRTVLRDALEEAGMRVTEAADADAAIRSMATTKADVMILDFLLPSGTGLDVWDYARERYSGLAHRTIVLTGVMDDPEREQMTDHTDLPVLAKPFETDVLIHMIRTLVEE
ncbi:MAG: response regulator [Acidobacteriota bacterium]